MCVMTDFATSAIKRHWPKRERIALILASEIDDWHHRVGPPVSNGEWTTLMVLLGVGIAKARSHSSCLSAFEKAMTHARHPQNH